MQDLVFIASGFGIVMAVLAALWGICASVGAGFTRFEAAAASTPAAPAAAPAGPAPKGPPPGHLAAIAAAVASLPASYRIVRVSAPPHISRAWAAQGRFEQHAKWQSPATAATRVQISNNRNDGHDQT